MTIFTPRPSAKVADGRLVLSLPDAETPAVWVMDLSEAATSVLRLETDKQNFYILKRHGAKGGETVAVYRDRARGVRALKCASSALEKVRSTGGKPTSRWSKFVFWFLSIWFVLYLLGADAAVLRIMGAAFTEPATTTTTQAPAQAPAAPKIQSGVPMSADDFLQQSAPTLPNF